ncbi:hypothetical protein EI94DRAFT_1695550 [Lactarius quietus]|nr:hypothetical protein EI94DRAFT_1695550 [Lactarius quietus]
MNTYKLWKPTAVSLSQEPDRQRRKPFSSSSHHKNPDARTAGKDDPKLRSGRGYVSDGPPQSSQTLAPTYPPPAAPSLATANRASHLHTPTQASHGHPANMTQKTPLPAPSLPQDARPSAADRYLDPTQDSRATSQRATTATDKKPFASSDPVRHSDDHRHKSSRHRSRAIPSAALESAQPQTTSAWPLPTSFLKKDGGEKDRDPSRTKVKDEPKSTSKSKERRRTERIQEQASRDQQEQSTRNEEERRRYKEERRREKERRREEEQRRDESHHEQKVKEDQIQRATRHQERRPEAKDSSVPQFLGKDPRLARVKDSDDSDNSLMRPQGSIRPKRHRQRDHTTPVAIVPSVFRQSTHPITPAPVSTGQPESGPSPNLNESRQTATLTQPSSVTLGTSNDKYSAKPHKGSPSQNLTVPYPPGYGVSASDSEHATKREHRSKPVENGRSIERPRTSGGHRTSFAHEAVYKPPPTPHAQAPIDRSSHKSEKQTKGGFGGWLFHRDGTGSYPKSAEAHATNQNAIQATARVATPSVMRNDTSEYIPRAVSIRAGEGPADYLQETSARQPAQPTVPPAARDVTVQPLPTVQALQQPQTVDRQPRPVPRVAASVQLEPPSHASAAQLTSPRPWLQSAQLSAEPQPMSPIPQLMSPAPHPMSPAPHPMLPALHPISPAIHPMSSALHPMSPAPRPPVVPSPMVFPITLPPPPAVVETHRQTMPARSHHGPPTQEGPNRTQAPQEAPWPQTAEYSRPPAPTVPSHSVPSPAATNGQRASPQGATFAVPEVVSTKPPRQRFAPVGYGDSPPVHVIPPPSRPIAPDLAASFPIREDNAEAYHRYSTREERAQETRASRNIPEQWDRHGHTQENTARLVVSSVPSSERTPRSTRTSPNMHPRPVNQGTPPKSNLPPILPPTYQPQASTNDLPQSHDTSQPGVYNVLSSNLNPSAYPATSLYPSSSSRTHVEASPVINDSYVANASSNNPSPKVKPGNPSPRSRSQAVAPSQQGPTHPVAVHVTNRTPSHETGSTTLLGQTPSSQGSMLLPVPMSPMSQHQVIVTRAGNYSGQQSVHIPAPAPEVFGDRNTQAVTQTLTTPAARPTTARHHHSSSAPTVPVSSVAQPPPVRSQTQPTPKILAPVSPMPVRPYSTAQALGDPYATRYPGSGYPSTPAQMLGS